MSSLCFSQENRNFDILKVHNSYLYHVITHGSREYDVSKKTGIVSRTERHFHKTLPVAENIELGKLKVGGHPDWLLAVIPRVLEVGHGVAEALDLHGAHLGVEGEVGQVHGAGGGHSQPHAPQHVARVGDPEELVLCGGRMEHGDLLVDKKGVRNPDELDVLGSHHQIFNPKIVFVEAESWVAPVLAEVHVEGEVHELLAEVADAEDVEADAHCDGDAAVVGSHPPVVANLERVQDVWDVDSWESSTSGPGDNTSSFREHWQRPEEGEEG